MSCLLRPLRRRPLLLAPGAGMLALALRPAAAARSRTASAATLSALDEAEAARAVEDRLTLALLLNPLGARQQGWEDLQRARWQAEEAQAALLSAIGADPAVPEEPGIAARIRVLLAVEASRRTLRARTDRVAVDPTVAAPGPAEWQTAMRSMDGAVAMLRHALSGGPPEHGAPVAPVAPAARRRSAGAGHLPPLWDDPSPAPQPREAMSAGLLLASAAGAAALLALAATGLRLWARQRGGPREGSRSDVRLDAVLTPSGETARPVRVFNLSQGGAALRLADPVLLAGERVTLDIAGVGALAALVVQHAGGVLRLNFNAPGPRQAEALARLMRG